MGTREGSRGRTLLWAALLLAALAPPARALDPSKPLDRCSLAVFRARDGLPGPWVRAIAQTPDGYLWVASYGGLVRHDGARFVPIGSGRAFPGVNDIAELLVASDGRLWIVTSNGDPLCVRGEEVERCLPPAGRLPAGARLSALLPEPDGSVWMATHDELYRFSGGRLLRLGGMADRPNVADPRLPFGRVAAIMRDGQGVWLATDRGLFAITAQGVQAVPSLSGAIGALARASDGGLWAATAGSLVRLHGPSLPPAPPDVYPSGRVNRLIEDRHGSVWIASAAGLTRYREGGFTTFTSRDGLPDDNVTAVFEDREGSLWVGTRGGGLAQLTDRTLDTYVGPPSLRDQQVASLAEDAGGVVWLGSRIGLVRWQEGRERIFTTADGLPADRVNAVLPAPDGALWVGTDRGVLRWRGERPEETLAYDGPANALHRDRAGALWIGGQGVVLRWQDGRLDRFPLHPGLKGQVRALAEDDRGETWAACIGGIGHLEGGRFEEVPALDGLQVVTGRSLHADRQGTLWFATNAGLVARAGGRFRVLPVDLTLTGQLYQVLSEEDGHLWVGTTRGLARLDPRALAGPPQRRPPFSELVFDTSDRRRDAAATGTRQPGAWPMRDGRLWFGSDQGLLAVDPRHLPIDALAPSVVIERALLDGRPAAIGTANELPPGPGNLEFHFAAITLVDAHRARHRYRLDGFDREWIDAGTRRVAQYTNIPPGRYRFVVQGSNADGAWSTAEASVAFTLAPHFYVTAWFRALVAAALVALALLLYRLRLRGLRRAYLAAFEERGRVARELHDTLLQGMSAIGLQLRGIRRRLEREAPAAARQLESVEDMVTMSLDETRRFVWNLREQAPSAGDLGVALARLADRLTHDRGVVCQTRVEGPVRPLPNGVQDQLFRIAQEALSNAVKHAGASHIDLALAFEPERVRLVVTDNGCGFDPAAAPGVTAGHFGLAGMRERAQGLGSLIIDSRPGAGSRVEIAVADVRKEPDVDG